MQVADVVVAVHH